MYVCLFVCLRASRCDTVLVEHPPQVLWGSLQGSPLHKGGLARVSIDVRILEDVRNGLSASQGVLSLTWKKWSASLSKWAFWYSNNSVGCSCCALTWAISLVRFCKSRRFWTAAGWREKAKGKSAPSPQPPTQHRGPSNGRRPFPRAVIGDPNMYLVQDMESQMLERKEKSPLLGGLTRYDARAGGNRGYRRGPGR